MKILTSLVFIFAFLFSGVAFAASNNTDVEQLAKEVEQLKEKVSELQDKEEEHSKDIHVPDEVPEADRSQIEYRESFTDQQEAAPRPYDLTIQPTYHGFIPIPHTPMMIRFNAKPRLDFIGDSGYPGNSNMFVTASIPVTGDPRKGGGFHYSMSAQGTQLSMDVRAPNTAANPRFYYENDFSGPGNQYMNFKVRHLYGQLFNVVVGQTYTVFEDADAWPDTVDYEGPNAAVSARRPLLKYMLPITDHLVLSMALEMPNCQVDTSGDPAATTDNHAPEGGFNFKWAKLDVGHVQFGTIFREIGVHGGTFGKQLALGWGLNFSSSINLFKNDSFQTQLTYGQGIFYFMNDATENGDAAFSASGKLEPLPLAAATVGYTHRWAEKWRSTGTFGFVNLENEALQNWDAYHRTYYGSLNVVFQIYKRLCAGIEGLYGYKQVKNGNSGQDFRGQVSIMYSLF